MRKLKLFYLLIGLLVVVSLLTSCTKTEVTASEESEITQETREEREQLVLKALETLDVEKVHFAPKEKMYIIISNKVMTADAILTWKDNRDSIELWEKVIAGYAEFSETVYEALGPGYSIAMADYENPEDANKILFMIKDGKVLYNILD